MKTLITTVLGLGLLASAAAQAGPPPANAQPARHAAPVSAGHGPQAHAPPRHVPARPALPARHQAHKAPPRSQPAAHGQATRHHYRKGERLQAGRRGAPLADWRGKGLRSPGRGQEWRQVDARYLLVATATGVIVDILSAGR